jgi:hypothetical protein
LNDKFTEDSRVVEYALNFIGDKIEGSNSYVLNRDKIIKSIVLAILYVKGDFYLKEFISAIKGAINLALPLHLQASSNNSSDVKMAGDD